VKSYPGETQDNIIVYRSSFPRRCGKTVIDNYLQSDHGLQCHAVFVLKGEPKIRIWQRLVRKSQHNHKSREMGRWTTLKFIGQVTAIVHIAPHFGIFVYCADILLKEVAPLICVRMLGADYQRNM